MAFPFQESRTHGTADGRGATLRPLWPRNKWRWWLGVL